MMSDTHTWMNMFVDKGTLIDSRAIIVCDPYIRDLFDM